MVCVCVFEPLHRHLFFPGEAVMRQIAERTWRFFVERAIPELRIFCKDSVGKVTGDVVLKYLGYYSVA
jgi:hypothetical protein